ncbi:MAG TPA: DUF6125 family protein [Dehalococcoidia bacterium]|nr:DUF6125 family protein [Dehalococcoidia bacterium]
MSKPENLQPRLRERAGAVMAGLSAEEREALLVRCWMSHDARWFMAVAQAYGLEAAGRLNQVASHEEGKAEAHRIMRVLGIPPSETADDYLLLQETIIGLLGPELLEYQVVSAGDDSFEVRVQRCFAHENVARAGVADTYECGIFARVTGWLEAAGLKYEMTPSLGKCHKAAGRECVYSFKLDLGTG